jgi:type VI secretion system protein ImpG
MSLQDPKHLRYYEREISFLRQMGATFAAQYPKIAKRLSLGENESPDPHVERLIESFAFLTSYLQKDIDDQFPRISSALLNVLYPQLTNPVPPVSIAEFKVDPSKGKMTTGYAIPKEFSLFTTAKSGEVCRFRTCYPLTLWPIEIADIQVVRSDDFGGEALSPYPLLLKVKLETLADPLSTLELKTLRFYISGDNIVSNALFEYLFSGDTLLGTISNEGEVPRVLPKGSLAQVGFDPDEMLLPNFNQAHPAYQLLQEYFVFPNKFLFFDIQNLDFTTATQTADILIPLCTYDPQKIYQNLLIKNDTLKLGCTPIINLFPKITDPIRLDKKKIEYPLVADMRRNLVTEIYSLEKVVSVSPISSETTTFSPYFSYDHPDIRNEQQAYWSSRRVPSADPNVPGTDLMLSFVNLDFSPAFPAVETVYAYTLCTNRALAEAVLPNTELHADEAVPTKSIVCLLYPTATVYPDQDGAAQWKLISQLAVNYLSLDSTPESLKAFQEILRVYSGSQDNAFLEISGISNMTCEKVVRRFGKDAWRGFVRGTSVTLTLDDANFAKKEALLFSSVLSRFLGLYCSINSFVELSVKRPQESEVWRTWPPIAGETTLV